MQSDGAAGAGVLGAGGRLLLGMGEAEVDGGSKPWMGWEAEDGG